MSDRPTSRIALVTGAGSGIGRAVAEGLLDDGFFVVLAGRRPEPLAEMVAAAEKAGQHALAVPTDVRDPNNVQALFDQIEKTCGRLDLLFNNAGINAPAVTIDELPVTKLLNVIATNITGVFLCARAAFGLMKRHRRRAVGSSTTVRSRLTPHARSASRTRPANMRCLD
jgi:NAD(P)-dependent dehydrogenase (short-subunit alcohol dehydrogenase family)